MTNRHFGKIADVWKHIVLNEVLAGVMPQRYAETHAGSAAYPMLDDPERTYGIVGFLEALKTPALATAPFTKLAAEFIRADSSSYPGSALQAMSVLGNHACYLLCDLDPISAGDLAAWAARLGAHDCEVAERDGMTAVREWLPGGAIAVVHIDPFDPFARFADAPSAIELAGEVAEAGHVLVYWYGYSEPAAREWAVEAIQSGTDAELWSGDVMIAGADGAVRHDGDLGDASTAGTGFGVVLANVPGGVLSTCGARGDDLASAYEGMALPSGETGRLDVRCSWSP